MRVLIYLVVLLTTVAQAQDYIQDMPIEIIPQQVGQTWSAVGPRTAVPGARVLEAEVGYPRVSVGYWQGVLSGLNVGGRVSFAYGFEGMLRDVAPGFKVQGLLKYRFFEGQQVSFGVTFEPGLFVHSSFVQGTRTGLALPVGVRLGIAASSALAVAISVDAPFWFEIGRYEGWNVPILTGGGVEYFITSQWVVFFKARIGPTLRGGGRATEVTLDASLGAGYRF